MRAAALLAKAGPYVRPSPTPNELAAITAAGLQLRAIQIRAYLTKGISTEELTASSFWHTANGGTGMEDLALDPRILRASGHHNALVKLILGREFGGT